MANAGRYVLHFQELEGRAYTLIQIRRWRGTPPIEKSCLCPLQDDGFSEGNVCCKASGSRNKVK